VGGGDHELDLGERPLADALGQLEKFEAGVLGVDGAPVALEGGSGGAEEQHGAGGLRAPTGDGHGLVARRGVLLVRGLVLLVHDDDAEVLHRGEQRGAGANDDPRLPAADAFPFVVALAEGE